uniref:Flavodoxin-like fold domain-containing protein n=1 Tax=Acanthochromis polyacanthus TaxID=80966 RepID=A0A3Q1EF39_9TELE
MIIRTGSQKTALIVFAHQTPASFNATARDVAVQELSDQGYRVLVSDLYAMKFRAEATRDDIKGELKNPELFQYGDETMFAWMENQLSEDITAEQQKVTEAELIIFQVREDKPHLQLWLLSVSLWLFCASLWSLFAPSPSSPWSDSPSTAWRCVWAHCPVGK